MIITEHMTVADVAAAVPSSIAVFQRYGIDFCCGGRTPLAVACEERGVSFAEVAGAVSASGQAAPGERDWSQASLGELIDHIIATYHEPLREELPRLQSMASKAARVHGEKAPQLLRVEALIGDLAADLGLHMQKEEMILFPAIRAVEAGNGRSPLALFAPIDVMEREHDQAGGVLSELRAVTEDYATPVWACATLQALYQGLSELESTMHVHVHLENNLLFPRALGRVGDTAHS